MTILLGTISEQKIKIIKQVLSRVLAVEYSLMSYDVNSEISEQPFGLAEIKKGAKNRASNALKKHAATFDYSIGLEGGLIMKNGVYNLVCVVVIIDKNNNYSIGISDYMALPKKVSDLVNQGHQFGYVIREYQKNMSLNNKEKIIVKELIERKNSFASAFLKAWLLPGFGMFSLVLVLMDYASIVLTPA